MAQQPYGVRKFTIDILPTGGMNTALSPAALPHDKSPELYGVVCKGNYLENFPAPEVYSSVPASAPPDGYFIMQSGRRLMVCDGHFYVGLEGSPQTLYQLASNVFTPGKECSMAEWDGVVYITNGYDPPGYYNPNEGTYGVFRRVGIASVTTHIVVDYFQSDTGWSGGTLMDSSYWANPAEDGISRSNPPKSRKLSLSTPNSSVSMTRTFSTPLNISQFPSGFGVSVYDLLEFRTYHTKFTGLGNAASGVAISVTINDGSTNWTTEITTSRLAVDKWGAPLTNNTQPNFHEVWHRIPLFTFTDSSGYNMTTPITSISSITFTIYSSSTGEPVDVYFDTCHIAKTPSVANSFAKEIPGIQGLIGGTIVNDPQVLDDYAHVGKRFVGPVNSTFTTQVFTPIDLTKWIHNYDNLVSNDSDEIVFTVFFNKSNEATGGLDNLRIKFYSGTNIWSYNVTPLVKVGKNVIYIKKSDFTVESGAIFWNSVDKVGFTISTPQYTSVTLSYLRMELSRSEKGIVKCNSSDNTNLTISGFTKVSSGPLPPGVSFAYALKSTSKGGVAGTFTILNASIKDFTLFDDGTPSLSSDDFSWWMYHEKRGGIDKLLITLTDNNGSTATYTLPQSMFTGTKTASGIVVGDNLSGVYSVKKSMFSTTTGGGFNWANVVTITFMLYATRNKKTASIRVGLFKITRGSGIARPCRWIIRYLNPDGFIMDSQPSIWYNSSGVRSDPLPLRGASGFLSEIPTPPDSNVSRGEIYRQGTTGEYYLEEVLYKDSTGNFPTGIVVGVKEEDDLGQPLDTSQAQAPIGDGRHRIINGKKNLFNGAEQWVWGVDGYPNYVFLSTPFYPFALSFDRCMRFAHEVLNVVLMNNAAFVFTKGGIVRVSGSEVFLYEHAEKPAGPACKGPSGTLFFTTERGGIYLFDGSYPYNISAEVEESWRQYGGSGITLFYADQILYASIPTTPIRTVYAYYLPTKTWTIFNRDNLPWWNYNLVPVGAKDGVVYFIGKSLESGNAAIYQCDFLDPANWAEIIVRTADIFGAEAQKYRVESVSIWAESTSTPNTQVIFYKDGTQELTGESFYLSPGIKEHRFYIYGRPKFGQGVETGDLDVLGTTLGVKIVIENTVKVRLYRIRLECMMLPEGTNV